jgi:spore coat polysaccharide biosynthesis protein SpsF
MEVGQSNKVVAIIQARMQSTRLPGKVLMPMPFSGGTNILGQIVRQLQKSSFSPTVIVATSINKSDDEIAKFCKESNIIFYRGDEDDVHSRFYEILKKLEYKTAIRVTGDNPILDVDCLDFVVHNHQSIYTDYSFTSDLPMGMNLEVFDVKAFLAMSQMELTPEDKEHVTLKFKTEPLFTKNPIRIDVGITKKLRLTVDYASDYLMLSTLFDVSNRHKIEPSLKLIQFVLDNYPWVFQVNENNFQKKQFISLEEEITYSIDLLNSLDLKNSAKYLAGYVCI